MNGFVCCNCEASFPESAAVQTEAAGGFIEFCCPYCGSDDIEDAVNLEAIREAKANRDEAAWCRQQEKLMQDGPDTSIQAREDQQLRDAGRGHLVHT